ncbi:MAG: lysophospholipid acyltransferase family protein [Bdellovibrionaceae bacterium]|nr:lysophospholipid acyltransferase family protein [Pseudobdellovibrionaceae bacterium]
MFQKVYERLLGSIIFGIYWLISHSWRLQKVGWTPRAKSTVPRVFAHWHGDELLLIGAHSREGMAVLSSHSRDGQLMGWVLSKLGYFVLRGSSSKGGAAGLKGLIDAVKRQGRDASIAVDGPRGPIYKVKAGVLKLAQATGCQLIPGVSAAERRYTFEKAWNQCYLPYPLSRCVVLYGEPLTVPRRLSEDEFEAIRLKLESDLIALKAKAEAYFSRSFEPSTQLTGVANGV